MLRLIKSLFASAWDLGAVLLLLCFLSQYTSEVFFALLWLFEMCVAGSHGDGYMSLPSKESLYATTLPRPCLLAAYCCSILTAVFIPSYNRAGFIKQLGVRRHAVSEPEEHFVPAGRDKLCSSALP